MKLIDLDNCQTMDYKLNQIADLNGMTPEQYRYYTKGWRTLWGMILELPIIEPKQEWISCKERPPEEDGDYLVCYEEGYREDYGFDEIGIAPFEVDCEGFGFWQDRFDPYTLGFVDSDWVEIPVTAWMPLPEPYGGNK